MRTSIDCMHCFVRQALDAARMASADTSTHEKIMREVLAWVSLIKFDDPPPVLAQRIHQRLRELTGTSDVYASVKKKSTETAQQLLPEMEALLQQAQDPFDAALRLAIAGNVIDFGVCSTVRDDDVRAALFHALDAPLHGAVKEFPQAVHRAHNILYLADNAGEIVFDRLLIRQLNPSRVTVAVRGAPVLNDATMADARAAGLDAMARLIDNGSDAPGTLLDDCSEEFKRSFAAADLIIAKGQGNFKTLSEAPENIFFLFKVKCSVVAGHTGVPVGTNLITCNRACPP